MANISPSIPTHDDHDENIETIARCCPELPKEIWLNVFSSFDYLTLKKSQRVCKLFKALTKLHDFDAKLFRQHEESDEHPQPRILHPALEKFIVRDVSSTCDFSVDYLHDLLGGGEPLVPSSGASKIVSLTHDFSTEYALPRSVATELAIMPPFSHLSICVVFMAGDVEERIIIHQLELQDITVEDVLALIADRMGPSQIWLKKNKFLAMVQADVVQQPSHWNINPQQETVQAHYIHFVRI